MPQIVFDVFSIITSIGIFILLFFIIILLRRRENRKANIVLSLLLAVFAFSIFNVGLLYNTNLYYFIPHAINLGFIWLFLFGPLFLFYVRTLTKSEYKYHKLQFLHFLPLLAYLISELPFFLQGGDEKISYMNSWLAGTVSWGDKLRQIVVVIVIAVHIAAYVFVALRTVKKYQQKIMNDYSSIEKLDVSWVRVLIGLLLITLIVISISAVFLYFSKLSANDFFRIVPSCVTFFSCLLAYKGLTQSDIRVLAEKEDSPAAPKIDAKYSGYVSQKKAMAENFSRLNDLMSRDKLYQNPDVSIQDLAIALGIPRAYISYILNEHAQISFYDFVNRYRVEEAKGIMADPKNKDMTVLDIAFESGFNSKSAFNSYFKKLTRLTPTEFMKQNHKAAGE